MPTTLLKGATGCVIDPSCTPLGDWAFMSTVAVAESSGFTRVIPVHQSPPE